MAGPATDFPAPDGPMQDAPGQAKRWVASYAAHLGLLIASLVLAPWGGWAGVVFAALVSAFATVQLGYHAHDFEHGQVAAFRRHRHSLAPIVWNLVLGVSASWWREKHGRHHVETHVPGRDPDLYPMFCYDEVEAGASRGLRRYFVRWQARLFWPVTAFARMYFQILSLQRAWYLPLRARPMELFFLVLHHAAFAGVAFALLGPRAPVFLAIAQFASGLYMGLAFSTNHLGMPYADRPRSDREWQVEHTRNIRGGWLCDYLLGGLNLQIEHHLYPNLSRHELRRLQPAVERHCLQTGIHYRMTGLRQALLEVWHSLASVAAGARAR